MSKVTLRGIRKSFGNVDAVKNLDLEIEQGEFFSLLGPSGCGKTTTLRMIAGFEFPTSGQVLFNDKDVTFLKPNHRNTGMVFQNFALFPHMTVFENIGFGLRARKVARDEITRRVEKSLDMVDLGGLGKRKVTELSGGQQQRVALARAIVIEPEILLLDEPLSNLDAKLRQETRIEIKALQSRLKITTIYVTHDQEEALTLSDRIAVMREGVCLQVGSPREIYAIPANQFVANFVGDANILSGKRLNNGVEMAGGWQLQISDSELTKVSNKDEMLLSIRPEDVEIVAESNGTNILQAKIESVQFSGTMVDYNVQIGETRLRIKNLLSENSFNHHPGSDIFIRIKPEKIFVLNE